MRPAPFASTRKMQESSEGGPAGHADRGALRRAEAVSGRLSASLTKHWQRLVQAPHAGGARPKGRPWKRAAGVAAVAALLCSACSGNGSTGSKAAAKPVLTVGEVTPPSALNPTTSIDGLEIVQEFAYEGLTTWVSPKTPGLAGVAAPGLATSWRYLKSSPPNTKFEFTLRHNARFADGTPVTAQAVETWFNYLAKSPLSANWASYFGVLKSVQTVGKWTVVIQLKSPSPNVPYGLTNINLGFGTPASPKCVAHPSKLNSGDCGAGPYMVDSAQTTTGSKYTFVPNPYYYDKSAQHWSKVVLLVVPTESSLLQALRTGEIQLAQADASTAAAAKAAGMATPGAADINAGLFLNLKRPTPLRSLLVRQAMNYAVNRKALAAAFGGNPESEVVTNDGYYPKDANYYPYDPAKAKALLAKAGYKNGVTIPDVVTYGPMGDQGTPQIDAVARQLAQVGIKLQIVSAPTNAAWASDFAKAPPANQNEYSIDHVTVYYQLTMGGANGWNDSTINGLFNKALIEPPGSNAARADYQAIMARTVTQAYYLPTLLTKIYLMYNPQKVANVQVSPALNWWSPWAWTPK
jgi:peptide/nickel transport system substrate-binding protein